jgi:hypothetical protein
LTAFEQPSSIVKRSRAHRRRAQLFELVDDAPPVFIQSSELLKFLAAEFALLVPFARTRTRCAPPWQSTRGPSPAAEVSSLILWRDDDTLLRVFERMPHVQLAVCSAVG